METDLRPDRFPAIWRGAISWAARNGTIRVSRLPDELLGRAFAPSLLVKSREAAGVRADMITAASNLYMDLELSFDYEPIRPARLDILVDDDIRHRLILAPGRVRRTLALPPGEHRVQLWLPQIGEVWLRSVRASGPVRATPSKPRWTAYGSSITQGGGAAGPAETWPALVARRLDWDLTCLGFGGQCHLDPIVAKTVKILPADLISLCIGINVQQGESFSQRTFRPIFAGVLDDIRAGHATAPIVVISPIYSPGRETIPNRVGVTLQWIRDALREVIDQTADPRITAVDGLSIIGPEDVGHLPDGLHPDEHGYRLMGARLADVLRERLAAVRAVGRCPRTPVRPQEEVRAGHWPRALPAR